MMYTLLVSKNHYSRIKEQCLREGESEESLKKGGRKGKRQIGWHEAEQEDNRTKS